MPTPGQTTLYKPEYCELAHNYCLLGVMFWPRNRQREYWQARVEAPLEPEIVDDRAARLAAAGRACAVPLNSVPDGQIAGGNYVLWPVARRRRALARQTYSPTLLCMIPPSANIVVAVR